MTGQPNRENLITLESNKDIYLYSFSMLLLMALLVQFSQISFSGLLLHAYGIPFTWNPLFLKDVSADMNYWTHGRLFMVYGLMPSVQLSAGLLLMRWLQLAASIDWQLRLKLTWLAFLMVNLFPAGIISGLFIFDGLGVAFTWLVPPIMVRGVISVFPVIAMVITRFYWIPMFLRASYSLATINETSLRNTFLRNIFTLPWLFTFLVIALFSFFLKIWYWPISFFALLFVIIPFLGNPGMRLKIKVNPSYKLMPDSRFSLFYLFVLSVAIFLSSLVHIRFT